MNDLKLNTIVKVVEPSSTRFNQNGVIIEVDPDEELFPYLVEFADGVNLWFTEVEVKEQTN